MKLLIICLLFLALILTETIAIRFSPKINEFELKTASGYQREIFERLVKHVDPSVGNWLMGLLFGKWENRKSIMKILNVGSDWSLITIIKNTGNYVELNLSLTIFYTDKYLHRNLPQFSTYLI